MFARWGDLVYRLRYGVIGAMVAGMLALGAYGLGVADKLSQSGFDDPGSESTAAALLKDGTYGRDHSGDVIAIYTAPPGKTVDDPEFNQKVTAALTALPQQYPNEILGFTGGYFKVPNTQAAGLAADKDKQRAFEAISIRGDTDTEVSNNYKKVESAFSIDGVDVELAGLQPVTGGINATMQEDLHRMELIALPAVGILLFFVFGGVVAAALPLIIGGLTVLAANGIVRLLTEFTEVNAFVSSVVSLVGLGLAIDYGLFITSRFREELGAGQNTAAAVRRSVMTAGRTVVFSATMIIASVAGLLLFPQGFLKSVAYGTIATVSIAALSAITLLPAILGVLGPRVDALGLKFFRKTKSPEEIEAGIWGRLTRFVMRHPLKIAIPIVIGLLLLIIPVSRIEFGGISEKYLPPDNPARMAQEEFDATWPIRPTNPLLLVIKTDNSLDVGTLRKQANQTPGLVGDFQLPTSVTKDGVWVLSGKLDDPDRAGPAIEYLRGMPKPADAQVLVGGTPAIGYDSVEALLGKLPLMILVVVLITTLLMFLTFGSLVLPIKAALMSALGLGSTLGILTWIFIDGHGSGLLNFTPGPISSPILVLIIAIIYGLSTDYEVFLLSRMVEARALGASTTEAVRTGTAHSGRIITAAALILIVVTGAFGFSQLVMMQYIAYGMISALIIDATLLRMFLVPATMKLLGDDCWWAPAWMKRVQAKLGMSEPILSESRLPDDIPQVKLVGVPPLASLPTTPIGPLPTARAVRQNPPPVPSAPQASPSAPQTSSARHASAPGRPAVTPDRPARRASPAQSRPSPAVPPRSASGPASAVPPRSAPAVPPRSASAAQSGPTPDAPPYPTSAAQPRPTPAAQSHQAPAAQPRPVPPQPRPVPAHRPAEPSPRAAGPSTNGADDTGRHHQDGDQSKAISVSELLRRARRS